MLNAQSHTYIKITDKNKIPIEGIIIFDTITKKTIGFSNENGLVKMIQAENNIYGTRHISYFPYYFSTLNKKDTINIQLINAVINLPVAEIRDWSLMLLKAVEMIPKNTSQKTTLYKGLFISKAKSNNKPIFFQQAYITTQIKKYGNNNQLKIAVDSSFVLQKKTGLGADTSSIFLKPKIPLNLAYTIYQPLKKNSKDYNISLDEIINSLSQNKVYVIGYVSKIDPADSGKVYVEDSSYAILKVILYKKWKNYEVKNHEKIGYVSDHLENYTNIYTKGENHLYELSSVNCNINLTLNLGDFISKETATLKYISYGECKACAKITDQDIEKEVLSRPFIDKDSPFAIDKEVFEDGNQ